MLGDYPAISCARTLSVSLPLMLRFYARLPFDVAAYAQFNGYDNDDHFVYRIFDGRMFFLNCATKSVLNYRALSIER